MKRRGYFIMTLLIAAFALFAASQAFAANIGGWTIDPVLGPKGEFPVADTCNGAPCSKFEYLVYGGSINMSNLDMLVPVCNGDLNMDGQVDNDILLVKTDPSSGRLLDPGVGDTANDYFGVSNYQNRVLKLPYNIMSGNTFRFAFWTTRAKSADTSMQVKSGNKNYGGVIKGPACYTPIIGAATSKIVELKPGDPNMTLDLEYDNEGALLGAYKLDGTPVQTIPLTDVMCTIPGYEPAPLTSLPDGAVLMIGYHSCGMVYSSTLKRLVYTCTAY